MGEGIGENRLRELVAEDTLPAAPAEAALPASAPEAERLVLALKEAAGIEPAPDEGPRPGPAPAQGRPPAADEAGAPAEGTAGRGSALPPGATLAGAVEALLFIANEPMTAREIGDILDGASAIEVRAALRELRERYASRPGGFDLVEVAGGWRLLTRPEYAPWVSRLETVRREERLTKAQIEALAVIAYRQPVLRADVDAVRGADSGGAVRALVERGLVKVVGRADTLGRPLLYGTTDRFLEQFGLRSLKDLPRPKAEP